MVRFTDEQQELLAEYRKRTFNLATSTEPADRPRAVTAAKQLAKIGGITVKEILWVNSPEEGKEEYDASWNGFWGGMWASLHEDLRQSLCNGLRMNLYDYLWQNLSESLQDNLWYSLPRDLLDSPRYTLRQNLRYRLWDNLRYSLQDSLQHSLWSTLRDACWVASYDFLAAVGLATYSPRPAGLLELYKELLESCFALWILPGGVILCERPREAEVEDGKLLALTWRGC